MKKFFDFWLKKCYIALMHNKIKKYLGGILILTGILIPFYVYAQDVFTDELLNIENRRTSTGGLYEGRPYILIDPVDKGEDINDNQFKPIPYQGIQNFNIQTPFGQKTQAAFVPHTTDFTILLQVLGDGQLSVQETIQFVNTQNDFLFKRSLPKIKKGSFELIEMTRNGQSIRPVISQTDDEWSINDDQRLPAGIYTYQLSYILDHVIHYQKTLAGLSLDLTGTAWSLPVERFSALLLFPQKTPVFNTTVSFGTNNIQIPEAVTIQTDNLGNIYLDLNNPLPAHANIRLSVDFDKNIISPVSFWNSFFNSIERILFVMCMGMLLLYTAITYGYLKLKKISKLPLTDLTYYSFIDLRDMSGETVSADFLTALKKYRTFQKHSVWFITFLLKLTRPVFLYKLVLSLYLFISVTRKYSMTFFIFIAFTIGLGFYMESPLLGMHTFWLVFTAFLLLIFLYYKGEKPYVKKRINILMQSILNKNTGFGLSQNSLGALFIRYYPYSLVTNTQKEWINNLKRYNINLTPFNFLADQEETKL